MRALRDVTLGIPERAFTAIMGPSGSGKSTLLHCLAALDTPTSGQVFLGPTELTALSRRQQAQVRRDRVGFVFQSFNLVPTLSALENITLPQQLAGRRPDRAWLDYVIQTMGLAERLHHRPSELSGGQQQRVALARALVGRPEVIFADEPTGNLDTTASREMLSLLRNAVEEFGQTVVTVTHDPMIASYADQVLFFSDGQVVDQVVRPETHEVQQHLQHLDTPSSWHDRQQVPPQADGQQDMRSRRRRRTEDTGPGRPMVGSDDEVEVARQERWLQRIREQFDVEIHTGQVADGPDVRTRHVPPVTPEPSTVHLAESDDEGWLPPEQSWISGSAPQPASGYDETAAWGSQPEAATGAPAPHWEPVHDTASADAADRHSPWEEDGRGDVWRPSTRAWANADTTHDRGWSDPPADRDPEPEYDEWSPTQPTTGDRPTFGRSVPSSSPPVYGEWEPWPAQDEPGSTPTRHGHRAHAADPPTGGWLVGDDEDNAVERADDRESAADRVSPNGVTGAPAWSGPPVQHVRTGPRQPSNGYALDALQSLQAQLDRLDGSGRRVRSGGRGPRGDGPAERDADRDGRH